MAKVIEAHIETLQQDNANFNKGTQYGEHLMEESLQKFGLGRSILIDKNDRIIAGNKTHQKAVEKGFTKVVVVETDGNTLVAVKRKDIDIDTKIGREMALADNATSDANLDWDGAVITDMAEKYEFDPTDWGVNLDDGEDEQEEAPKGGATEEPKLVVTGDPAKLSLLYRELSDRGFRCDLNE